MRALAVVVAAVSIPPHGVFVPGHSLGGIRLGESATAVRAALGTRYGVCTACKTTTWYFTYKAFDQHGLGIEFTGGRVSAVYTLWQPAGWHATNGLRLGALEAQVTATTGPLFVTTCSTYEARFVAGAKARSVYYVVDGALWGFGLFGARASPCR